MENYDIDPKTLNAVWQRVTAARKEPPSEQEANIDPPPPQKTDEQRLIELIDAASAAAEVYKACAARCSGKIRRELLALSTAQSTAAQKLRARYYILTGKSYWPPPSCPYVLSLTKTLKMRYEAERAAYTEYVQAANATRDTSLSDLYFALAALSQRHADALVCLLESLL